jgi:hypothetical protein
VTGPAPGQLERRLLRCCWASLGRAPSPCLSSSMGWDMPLGRAILVGLSYRVHLAVPKSHICHFSERIPVEIEDQGGQELATSNIGRITAERRVPRCRGLADIVSRWSGVDAVRKLAVG